MPDELVPSNEKLDKALDDNAEKQVTLSNVLDAIKELTKAVTEIAEKTSKLEEEWSKWRKAGKF